MRWIIGIVIFLVSLAISGKLIGNWFNGKEDANFILMTISILGIMAISMGLPFIIDYIIFEKFKNNED